MVSNEIAPKSDNVDLLNRRHQLVMEQVDEQELSPDGLHTTTQQQTSTCYTPNVVLMKNASAIYHYKQSY